MSMLRERKLNRLRDYDYSEFGYYFVTICVKDRELCFGDVVGGNMILNKFGRIADQCWREIPNHFNNTEFDKYVIMPNHMHGIVVINDDIVGNATVGNADLRSLQIQSKNDRTKMSLSKIIHGFKSSTTRIINKTHGIYGNLFFAWQKSFYDRIIRNNHELYRIRKYIINNPLKWHFDRKNPENLQP